jgi:cyclic pyranopterin phosphate synthase
MTQPDSGPLLDRFARAHTYLRVSVTDRCNYRCTYCMPAAGLTWLKRDQILSFEEITRIVRAFASMGVQTIRLTGGEPTIRNGLPDLVAQLSEIEGIEDIAMTTNGHLFASKAQIFADAGLKRINVSIDSVDPKQFEAITRGGDVYRVLAAIDAARAAGLGPIKLNCVVVGGMNEDQVEAMVEHFDTDVIIRFIEYMPFGGNADQKKHVPARKIRERLARRWTLEPAGRRVGLGPARNYRIVETGQIIGFISPMTEHFCEACNRLRLQADGHVRTCLSRDGTPSLRDVLRSGASDEELVRTLRAMVWQKVAGHEAHLENFKAFEGVMTAIGG